MEYLFEQQDFFYNIAGFLDNQDLSNLLLVTKETWNNLKYTKKEYQEKRKLWKKYNQEFHNFYQEFISEINIIKDNFLDSLFCIYSFNYYDGTLQGLGLYQNKLCYYANRIEIVKKQYRLSPDNFLDFRNFNILDEDECIEYVNYYYEIIYLTKEEEKDLIRYIYTVYKGYEHWYNKILPYYRIYNIEKIKENEENRNKYIRGCTNLLLRLSNKPADLIIKKYNFCH
jgi:hypothetical protein